MGLISDYVKWVSVASFLYGNECKYIFIYNLMDADSGSLQLQNSE